MIYPTYIFCRFSKEKFMQATFIFKIYYIVRIIWALIKLVVMTFVLVPVYSFYLVVNGFTYSLLKFFVWLTDHDLAMDLIFDGLTTDPKTYTRKNKVTPDIGKLKWSEEK